jgi:serine/threonine protein kinase
MTAARFSTARAATIRTWRLVEKLVSKDEDRPSFLEHPAFANEPADNASLQAAPASEAHQRGPGLPPPRESLIGCQYGTYRILSLLGAGGMGEVYRAHDSKLDRDVAIKMLPVEFARDPGRLARFRREARVLASLNHPNIAAIYGLEEAAEGDYLVLELVEGDQLHGPLPVRAAIDLASQVAEALEAAHQHGIVHRDLKPANVKLTPEGRVKVLDFGLAKAIAGGEPAPMLAGQMPRVSDGSATGSVLGTPGYMSPEQARGEVVDRGQTSGRSGASCELLTGRRAFESLTVSDAVAAVLEHEPDWRLLSEDTPARLRDLLKRCVQKEASARMQSIADAREVLLELQRAHPRRDLGKPHASSVDAYELCLRARYHHQQRTPEGLATAFRLFEQAIERDPDCALAHAGIAHVCLIACYFGGMPTSVGMPRMKAAALRAVDLDETLAAGHVRLGDALCFKDWDWTGAEREFLRALELDPDSPEALSRYGLFLWARRRYEEALVQARKALDLDPLSLDTNWILGWIYLALGQLDQADETAGRLLAMAPNAWLGYHIAASAKWLRGLRAEAILDAEKAAAIEGGPAMLALYCSACARMGKLAEARGLLARLQEMATKRIVPPAWMVGAYDALGEDTTARACLEQALRERHMLLVHMRGWATLLGGLDHVRDVLDAHDL